MHDNRFDTSYFNFSKEDLRQLCEEDRRKEYTAQLHFIYGALQEKGYNPIAQIIGYILSEDPTYITAHNGARIIAQRMDRDEILRMLLENFLHETENNN